MQDVEMARGQKHAERFAVLDATAVSIVNSHTAGDL
jgi:hypothetical protein